MNKSITPPASTQWKAHFRKRKVCFQHLRTGRIITAPSITAFARRARLGLNGKRHFDLVLKGERLHHRGWGLPQRLNRTLELKDVYGNKLRGTVSQLARRFSTTALNRLAAGKPFGSIAPAEHDFGAILPPRPYRVTGYALQLPGPLVRSRGEDGHARWERKPGRVVVGNSLEQAGRRAGISLMGAFDLAHGYRPSVKGVTFHRALTERRTEFASVVRK